MIHLSCVPAVRTAITVSTQLYSSHFYTYYFQSPNTLYSCSNTSVAAIQYVTSYCQTNLHLTVICINSINYQYCKAPQVTIHSLTVICINTISYQYCKSPQVTIHSLTVTNSLKTPAVCLQGRETEK